jgi:hypothetical protein
VQPGWISQARIVRRIARFGAHKSTRRRCGSRKDNAALKQKAAIQKTTARNWRQIIF